VKDKKKKDVVWLQRKEGPATRSEVRGQSCSCWCKHTMTQKGGAGVALPVTVNPTEL